MLSRKSRKPPVEVLIAGGGVAALEAALGVHELAGGRARLTLLAPSDDFVYRPMAVFEPFLPRPASPRRLSLAEFAADVGATLERGGLVSVDCERRSVRTSSERELGYDALVIAVGASARNVVPASTPMSGDGLGESMHGVIQDLDDGLAHSLALVIPSWTTWPLPAYEVALLAQERVRERGLEARVTIVTAEEAPLAVFGDNASAGVAELLAGAGIEVITGAQVEMQQAGELAVKAGEPPRRFDRIVAVPQLVGPAIAGLPADAEGFLPITRDAQVRGVESVYAVGDATDFPVKQGGIAAEHADAAAESIAALAGRPVQPSPFGTDVHAMLLTSRRGRYVYLSATIDDGVARDSQVSTTPTWSPSAKVAARYLGPYLDRRWSVAPPGPANWHALSFLRMLDTRGE